MRWGRFILALRLFGWLFERIPMIELRLIAASAVMLAVLPFLAEAYRDQPDTGFLIGFWLLMILRWGFNSAEIARKLRAQGALGACFVLFVGICVLIQVAEPIWYQRVFSAVALTWGLILGSEMACKDYSVAGRYFPEPDQKVFLPMVTALLLFLHLSLLVLNETVIRLTDPLGWLVFAAVLPILQHVLIFAAMRTAILLTDPEGRD